MDQGDTSVGAVRRVIVGIDGSDPSRVALEWAGSLCRQLAAELIVVHAVGLMEHYQEHEHGEQNVLQHLQSVMDDDWCKPLRDRGVPYAGKVVEGNAVIALVGAAGQYHADLVIVGSRGAGGFSELHLGSTSQQLVMHCPLPVTIVPSGRAVDSFEAQLESGMPA